MRVYSIIVVFMICSLFGCQPPPLPHPPTVPEPPMVQAQVLCEPGPPQIIEVPVAVPMPGQLQVTQDPAQENDSPKKGERVGRMTKGVPFNSVTEYRYAEGALYQAYVAVGKTTSIFLAPGEGFSQAIIGDKSTWSADELTATSETQRGGVWVSCNEPGKRSTLTIPGTQHLYLLELHCTEQTFHAAISWTYRQPPAAYVLKSTQASAPTPIAPQTVSVPDAPSATRYTWESNRDNAWAPLHVYDTGVHGRQTIIVFPQALATTDAPALYMRSPEGTQGLVNYRVRQGYWVMDRIYPVSTVTEKLGASAPPAPLTYYLIDRIAERMELRVGEKSPTIVTIRQQF